MWLDDEALVVMACGLRAVLTCEVRRVASRRGNRDVVQAVCEGRMAAAKECANLAWLMPL